MAQLSNLLLFDPDPQGLDILTYSFEKDGYSVTATGDAARAHHELEASTHALLVVNLRSWEQTGLEVLRSSSSNPRTRNLPCVAIGRDEQRAAASTAGAFTFLSTPVFVKDVLSVCRLVAAATVPGSRTSPDTELSLNLEDLGGVYLLVRAEEVMGRSSVVEVRHGVHRGELRFIDGVLSSAEVGSVQGPAALYRMMLWEQAALHFKFRNVIRRGSFSLKSGKTLEECDRFLRDFAHESRELGTARTRYSADRERSPPGSALPSEVVPLLRSFDGQRDLAAILDESPFRIFDTLKVIKRFVSDGLVRLQTDQPAARNSDPPGGGALGGPRTLDFWFQKNRPPTPGPAQGGHPGTQNGIHLPAAVVGTTGPADAGGGGSAVGARSPSESGGDPGPTPAPRTPGSVARASGRDADHPHPDSAKRGVRGRPLDKFEDIITPAPVSGPKEKPKRPAAAVIRGEIKIAAVTRHHEVAPASSAETVVVALDLLPPPMPLVSPALPPVTAHQVPVVVPQAPPQTPHSPAPPPPTTSAASAAATAPGPVVASAGPSPPTPASHDHESKRHSRLSSDSFSVVEADFFEREADLYKRESVESFEDLEGSGRPVRKR